MHMIETNSYVDAYEPIEKRTLSTLSEAPTWQGPFGKAHLLVHATSHIRFWYILAIHQLHRMTYDIGKECTSHAGVTKYSLGQGATLNYGKFKNRTVPSVVIQASYCFNVIVTIHARHSRESPVARTLGMICIEWSSLEAACLL